MTDSTGLPQPATALPHEAYLTALASLDQVGPARLRWLLSYGSPELVWQLLRAGKVCDPPAQLAVKAEQLNKWVAEANLLNPQELWNKCCALGVGVLALGSAGYPPSLALDLDPPVVLFHLGNPDLISAPSVAIVGTRRATGYGLRVAEELGAGLAQAGVMVVSGLALGIDAAAHAGSLSVGPSGAAVAAVVGAGLDAPCPVRNRKLAQKVAAAGVIFSEVPPYVQAAPWRFPVRNRILAALADVVVVVESAGAGGSMHTVKEALARDIPIMSVPGPIDSRASEGTNRLLSDGAEPCLGVDDILMALGLSNIVRGSPNKRKLEAPLEQRPAPNEAGQRALAAIGWRPVSVEHLGLRSGLEFSQLASTLSWLETHGWIQRTGGWIERCARGD
ncbi:unannotated protein [freshwater metagenome]|uniref:Unannotated protein n=1 Tax=freshwater metagenome TaxID=449393 RepID=A0A6J6B4J4_9ZZZZ|nr:DNA-protecting protein DprA [Actinomycetota bacterium]MTA63257.1 DNA-protecting protein DprA [Actinomycetota bacterium]